MPAERPRRGKLAEAMANHILRHEDVLEDLAVMHGKRVSTKSGMIIERRDHVLMTALRPLVFSACTLSARWPSTNGPFLTERLTISSSAQR